MRLHSTTWSGTRAAATRRLSTSWAIAMLALALAAMLTAAGCSSSGGSSSSGAPSTKPGSSAPTATANVDNSIGGSGLPAGATADEAVISALSPSPTLEAMVPTSWKSKSSIKVATAADNAPYSFFASDNKTIVGWTVDLGRALGQVLGLKMSFANISFDNNIPGLQAGRYDLGMSGANLTPAREKIVTFVTQFSAGMSFMVQANSALSPQSLGDLCGHTVATETGSQEADAVTSQAATCKKENRAALTQLQFPTQAAVNLALNSNRAQIAMGDSPVMGYSAAQSHGQYKVVGPVLAPAQQGLVIAQGQSDMAKALAAAMNQLISGGQYATILKNWGVQAGAITASAVVPSS